MRELDKHEVEWISGGTFNPSIWGIIGNAAETIWSAMNGDAPGPSSLTGTASGRDWRTLSGVCQGPSKEHKQYARWRRRKGVRAALGG